MSTVWIVLYLVVLAGMVLSNAMRWRKVLVGFIWALFLLIGGTGIAGMDEPNIFFILFCLLAPCFYSYLYLRPILHRKGGNGQRKGAVPATEKANVQSEILDIRDGVLYRFSGKAASVTIPWGVTRIENYAFHGCTTLVELKLPDGLKRIGQGAFSGCKGLKSVNIPDGVVTIEEAAFSGCSKLAAITVPGSVTTIGKNAFGDCRKLTAISLSEGLESIGEMAFLWCERLVAVHIPASVKSIGPKAFMNCTGLTAVTFLGHVSDMGEHVFDDCKKLRIYAPPESGAGRYAQLHNIPFTPMKSKHAVVPSGASANAPIVAAEQPEKTPLETAPETRKGEAEKASVSETSPVEEKAAPTENERKSVVVDIKEGERFGFFSRYELLLNGAYGWGFMQDAVQWLIDHDLDDVRTFSASVMPGFGEIELIDELVNNEMKVLQCPTVQEEDFGVLSVGGESKTLNCRVKLVFFNQTRVMRIFCELMPDMQRAREYVETVLTNILAIQFFATNKDFEVTLQYTRSGGYGEEIVFNVGDGTLCYRNIMTPAARGGKEYPEGYFEKKTVVVDEEKRAQYMLGLLETALNELPMEEKLDMLPPGADREAMLCVSSPAKTKYYSNTHAISDGSLKSEPVARAFLNVYEWLAAFCEFPKMEFGVQVPEGAAFGMPAENDPAYFEETLWICRRCKAGNLYRNAHCVKCGEVRDGG